MLDIIQSIKRVEWKLLRRLKIVWEKINGLDFSENHSLKELGFTIDEANIYSATPDIDLKNVLTQLDIKTTDSILDYGAGKGAALVTMSKHKFNHVDGLELSKPLCEIARKNFKKLGKENIRLFNTNAKEFKRLDIYTYFYFFNPFPGNVLEVVLQNIADSYHRRLRKITVLYYLPAFKNVIEKQGFFKKARKFKTRYYEMIVYTN